MIQDIFPYILENTFCNISPTLDDYFFSFCNEKVLLKVENDGSKKLPSFKDLNRKIRNIKNSISFLFSINKMAIYLYEAQDDFLKANYLQYFKIVELEKNFPKWAYFAGVTALHLRNWYLNNVYCGKCGAKMTKAQEQRALVCQNCKNIVYPTIAPVVMVAVVNNDKVLLTKYSDRQLNQWVLISGFVEIGETIEQAAQREVFEETGLHIKNLKYFGSQPWGFSNSIIIAFIAELDGSSEIHIDTEELEIAKWYPRAELPHELSNISLTYELIETLRIKTEKLN